jgi:hypothetical protein
LAKNILEEYKQAGAVRKLESPQGVKHLIPWFIVSKMEPTGEKHRFITDCRELNSYFCPRKFRLEHMETIFPYLKKGWWGGKVDLKDAYFHLPLSENLQKFVNVQVGGDTWQFQGACFGISSLPQVFMSIMRVLERLWRKKGLTIFIYLDDIFLLGPSQKTVAKHLEMVVETLLEAGFKINTKKSILTPQQKILHLGILVDLKEGRLEVPPEKLKTIRKELGKVVKSDFLSCRKIASILGQVRSYLVALPFLRLVTSTLKDFSDQARFQGWDKKILIPQDLKTQLLELNQLLFPGSGRNFLSKVDRELHSDSSTSGWGGRPPVRKIYPRILEGEKFRPHQQKRNSGCSKHCNEPCPPRGKNKTVCGQHCGLQLPVQMGGQEKGVQRFGKTSHVLVQREKYISGITLGPIPRNVGRPPVQVDKRPGRLLSGQKDFPKYFEALPTGNPTHSGHVCLPRQPSTGEICDQVATSSSLLGGCLALSPGGGGGFVCQSPLDIDSQVASTIETEPRGGVPVGVPLLGFDILVGPVNKNVKTKLNMSLGTPQGGGLFTNCWGEEMPPTKWPLACTIVSGKFWKTNKWHLRTLSATF